jgi:hypothetical protein
MSGRRARAVASRGAFVLPRDLSVFGTFAGQQGMADPPARAAWCRVYFPSVTSATPSSTTIMPATWVGASASPSTAQPSTAATAGFT